MIDNANQARPHSPSRPKANEIVLALLEHPSLEKAAAALGVSRATVWRWLQKPENQELCREARRKAFSQSAARLQHGSSAAVSTLLRVMVDGNAPTASRVRAAKWVLDTGLHVMELEDFEARLQKLEAMSESKGGHKK